MLSTGPGPIAVGASAHDVTQMPAVDAPEFVGAGEGNVEVAVLVGDGNTDAGELARPAAGGLDPIVEPAPQALRTPAPSTSANWRTRPFEITAGAFFRVFPLRGE
jgi:hypothetical protein